MADIPLRCKVNTTNTLTKLECNVQKVQRRRRQEISKFVSNTTVYIHEVKVISK